MAASRWSANKSRGKRGTVRGGEAALENVAKKAAEKPELPEHVKANLAKGRRGRDSIVLQRERVGAGQFAREVWELTDRDWQEFEAFTSRLRSDLSGREGVRDQYLADALEDAWVVQRTARNIVRKRGLVRGSARNGSQLNEFAGFYFRTITVFRGLMDQLFPPPKMAPGQRPEPEIDESGFDQL